MLAIRLTAAGALAALALSGCASERPVAEWRGFDGGRVAVKPAPPPALEPGTPAAVHFDVSVIEVEAEACNSTEVREMSASVVRSLLEAGPGRVTQAPTLVTLAGREATIFSGERIPLQASGAAIGGAEEWVGLSVKVLPEEDGKAHVDFSWSRPEREGATTVAEARPYVAAEGSMDLRWDASGRAVVAAVPGRVRVVDAGLFGETVREESRVFFFVVEARRT